MPEARREWSINVLADRAEFEGSHRITFYRGSSNKPIGRAGIFRDNKPAPSKKLSITVPVTTELVDEGVSLDPQDAVPALKDLRWVIEKVGIRLNSVSSLTLWLILIDYIRPAGTEEAKSRLQTSHL